MSEKGDVDTLTVREVACRLRIGLNQAYEAARRNDFPVVKIGGRILVPKKAFNDWLAQAGRIDS